MERLKEKKEFKSIKWKRPDRALAMIGNKYSLGLKNKKATIWTAERVEKELNFILKAIKDNESFVTIGEAIENKKYGQQMIGDWLRTYPKENVIVVTYNRIKSILETRLNTGGLRNNLNPAMTIFNLKNNYGWKDRQETDINISSDIIDTDRVKRIAERIVQAKEIETPEYRVIDNKQDSNT